MANGDDINKELDATEETVEAQKAKLAVEEKLLAIRKELNSEQKTELEYEQDLEDIKLRGLRAKEDELAKEILLNQQKIEGGKLTADQLKVAKDDTISILPKYFPKFVSIPISDKSSSFSILNFFSTLVIKLEFFL